MINSYLSLIPKHLLSHGLWFNTFNILQLSETSNVKTKPENGK